MEATITFTPAQLIAICAGVITISTLAEKIVDWFQKARKPEKEQNEHLEEVDKKIASGMKIINEHDEAIDDLKRMTKTLQRGVYELLGSALDGGNNRAAMQEARDVLKRDIFGS